MEAYLLDFNGDLYGKTAHLEFVQRLRDEAYFSSTEELRLQIERDVEHTRQVLAGSSMKPDSKTLHSILNRGVAEVIVEDELKALLEKGEPLRLKMGFDPSAPDIHLGHTVGLRKLRQFQDLGHKVVLIVGDWTARIGDPSGQSATRNMLSQQEVEANAETYMEQFFRIVDRSKTEAVYQSEWFGKFDLEKVIRLTSKFTVAQFLAREDFSKRFREQRPIAITELLYPLLQAYDSVAIQADVEFGGTDQKFNLLVGRELQEMEGQRPQQILTVPILVGTDGVQKMSKSLGNYIGVAERPGVMFGKVMSINDAMIIPYFELLTDLPDEELEEMRKALDGNSVNPMELKKRLGQEIVRQFHDVGAARHAAAAFGRRSQGIFTISLPQARHLRISEILHKSGLVPSIGEAKRRIRDGAVKKDGRIVISDEVDKDLRTGNVFRAGPGQRVRIEEF